MEKYKFEKVDAELKKLQNLLEDYLAIEKSRLESQKELQRLHQEALRENRVYRFRNWLKTKEGFKEYRTAFTFEKFGLWFYSDYFNDDLTWKIRIENISNYKNEIEIMESYVKEFLKQD